MLNRDALLFSPTREGVPSSDDGFFAADMIAAQDALEEEAREAIPFSGDECTYDLGYIKQPLYACLTCLHNRAVCAGCSISCHAEHQLVELFNRRNFRCDCGTEAMGAGSCCSITGRQDAPANADNKYDREFHGEFCFCGKPYNPHEETDTMYQCVVCERWRHHGCVFGQHVDDEDEEDKAPLKQDDWDQLVCGECATGNREVRRVLERYAGVEGSGVMLVTKENEVKGKAFLPPDDDEDQVEPVTATGDEPSGENAAKRAASPSGDAPTAKKAKVDEPSSDPNPPVVSSSSSSSSSSLLPSASTSATPATSQSSSSLPSASFSSTKTCTAPPVLPPGESPLAKLEKEGGRTNVFLEEGWMLRWCRCSQCMPMFVNLPYLLEEEDVYEPPEDPQAHKSTFELGMSHLLQMPRAQAIDSITAFNGLSERLKAYLRPHAEGGVTVSKEMVDAFFAQEAERRAVMQRGSQL
ncbi:hypothetical protein JCM8097_002610 [Rhodosporidiobolus ruineniae]